MPTYCMLDHDELFSKDKARRLLEFLKMQFASMFNWVGEINNSEIRLTAEALIENQNVILF